MTIFFFSLYVLNGLVIFFVLFKAGINSVPFNNDDWSIVNGYISIIYFLVYF